jgi:hypothetical protein
MLHHATRPPLERMMAIDHALGAREWPNDKSLAAQLDVGPRTI